MPKSRRRVRPKHSVMVDRGNRVVLESHDCDVLAQIADLVAHRRSVDDSIGSAIQHARSEHNVSWGAVGEVLGLTRQGARQRYAGSDLPPDHPVS